MTQLVDQAFDSDPRIARILDIFAKETQTDRAALRPEATLSDLGVESIDLTMAVFEIESTFGVDIPVVADQAGAEFSTVGDLVSHVMSVLNKAADTAPEAPPPPATTPQAPAPQTKATGAGG
jgi:acyl carrier protein